MKAWMLLAHDPATGAASDPCGFVAFDGTTAYFEAVPGTDAVGWAGRWADFADGRAQTTTTSEALEGLLDVGGVGLGVVDISENPDLPVASNPAGLGALLVDGYLAAT